MNTLKFELNEKLTEIWNRFNYQEQSMLLNIFMLNITKELVDYDITKELVGSIVGFE